MIKNNGAMKSNSRWSQFLDKHFIDSPYSRAFMAIFELGVGIWVFHHYFDISNVLSEGSHLKASEQLKLGIQAVAFLFGFIGLIEYMKEVGYRRKRRLDRWQMSMDNRFNLLDERFSHDLVNVVESIEKLGKDVEAAFEITRQNVGLVLSASFCHLQQNPERMKVFEEYYDGIREEGKRTVIEKIKSVPEDIAYISSGRMWFETSRDTYTRVLSELCISLNSSNEARWLCLYPPYAFFEPIGGTPFNHIKAFNKSKMRIKERIVVFRNLREIVETLRMKEFYEEWSKHNSDVFCVYCFLELLPSDLQALLSDDIAIFDNDLLLKFWEYRGDIAWRGMGEVCINNSIIDIKMQAFQRLKEEKSENGGGLFFRTVEGLAYHLQKLKEVDFGKETNLLESLLANYGTKEEVAVIEGQLWLDR